MRIIEAGHHNQDKQFLQGKGTMRNFRCLLLSILLMPLPAFGQFYTSGEEQVSLHWQQIKTPDFRIVFPKGFEQEAFRLGNILDSSANFISGSIKQKPRAVKVIIHNQTVLSNGYVALAPRRMELYTLPPQDIYSQDWLEQLSFHELRHVVQMDKLNHGITRGLSYLVGQQAPGAIAGMVPKWFYEGDAVHSETSFSKSGRGRLPSFEMELRAMTLDGKLYTYDKMLNGSYRNYIPDHYQYGYKLTSYGRYRYGDEVWGKVLHDVGTKPYMIIPFTLSMKKNMGLTKSRLQKEAFHFYDSIWTDQVKQTILSEFRQINKRRGNEFVSYQYPAYLDDSIMVVLKSGMDQLPEFIAMCPSGTEKRLLVPGNLNIQRISAAREQFYWTEVIPDIRWPNHNYSVIKSYDIVRKKSTTLTRKTRYFSPSINQDGTKIVAVEITPENATSLVLLDAKNGKLLQRIASESNYLLIQPSWIDSSEIAVIVLESSGKSIQSVNIQTGLWLRLFDAGYTDMSDLSASANYIFFRAAFSGIDDIYAFNLKTRKTFRLTSSLNGAYYPAISANGAILGYSNYTSQGFNLVETKIPGEWKEISEISSLFNPIYEQVSNQEKASETLTNFYPNVFSVKPYREFLHLFNLHSWLPAYFNYDELSLDNPPVFPGLTLLSQNTLNTSIATFGYEYRQGEHYLHADYTYRGWFPVIHFSAMNGGPVTFYRPPNSALNSYDYRFLQMITQVYIPLNFTHNKMIRRVMPSLSLQYSNNFFYYESENQYRSGLQYITARLLAYQYLRPSLRDIEPRFGQVIDIQYLSTPFEQEQLGAMLDTRLSLYLPGLLKHHSLLITGYNEIQFSGGNNYRYGNRIGLARGYASINADQVNRISADYFFPLYYPDIRLGSLIYIKRLRADLFYDYARIDNSVISEYRSYGTELLTDFHLVRSMFPFAGGVRFIYLENDSQWKTELVFNVNLNDF
jgi:hypothetical protein